VLTIILLSGLSGILLPYMSVSILLPLRTVRDPSSLLVCQRFFFLSEVSVILFLSGLSLILFLSELSAILFLSGLFLTGLSVILLPLRTVSDHPSFQFCQ
jgi:hypothetical protein